MILIATILISLPLWQIGLELRELNKHLKNK